MTEITRVFRHIFGFFMFVICVFLKPRLITSYQTKVLKIVPSEMCSNMFFIPGSKWYSTGIKTDHQFLN